jgi:Tfp pilus assembly protein FimT
MTTVELLVVVSILAILAAIAVPAIRSSSYGGGVPGFAYQVDGLIDEARMRAVATQRWHRLVVEAGQLTLEQASNEGMDAPTEWAEIRPLNPPGSVEVLALGEVTTLDPGPAPTPGNKLGQAVLFSPDGSASAATIYMQRPGGQDPMRVTVVRATSASYVYSGW